MNRSTFIKADELFNILNEKELLIFDCSFDFKNLQLKENEYQKSHIPGAYYANLDNNLSGPRTKTSGNHPLPNKDFFYNWLVGHGLNSDSQVVVYDNFNGAYAARMWWMLKWIGFKNVAVLEGGLNSWVQRGYPLNSSVKPKSNGNFKMQEPLVSTLDLAEVEKISAGGGDLTLIDSRENKRYLGLEEPMYNKAGHVPGAKNHFFFCNINEDGSLKSTAEIKDQFKAVMPKKPSDAVFYCGSGVTACFNILVLEHIGLGGSKLYPGSYSQWISDENRKVETN